MFDDKDVTKPLNSKNSAKFLISRFATEFVT